MKKHKVTLLYLLVFLTSLLLTTTSYAWFTTTRIVSLDTFNIHVATDGGIQISTDSINWKAILEMEDLYNARENYEGSINQIPTNLEPVSTGGNVINGKLQMYYGQALNYTNNIILTATKADEINTFENNAEAKFIVFDIFLKTATPKTLYLSTNAGIKYDGEDATGIENAFRIAFLNQGTVSSENGMAAQNLNSASIAYIWEPNYDAHTLSAINNAKNTYGINIKENNERLIPYFGVINEIKESDLVDISDTYTNKYPNFFKNVNISLATIKNFENNQYLFNINEGITKFRVYIWIEGQDLDCEDGASIGDILFNLQITTVQ